MTSRQAWTAGRHGHLQTYARPCVPSIHLMPVTGTEQAYFEKPQKYLAKLKAKQGSISQWVFPRVPMPTGQIVTYMVHVVTGA